MDDKRKEVCYIKAPRQMKFKISQGDFSKALLLVNKSLPSRTNLPILANVLVSASGNKLEIVSTNLETATRVVIGSEVEKEGKVTVPGRILFEFISQLSEGEIVVERLGEEVLVSAKNYRARLAIMGTEDFPAIPKIEKGKKISIGAGDFAKGILKVVFCATQDEGRPVLTGILCDFEKESLSLVATDGYRLSFQKLACESEEVKIVVPAKALLEVTKIISEAEVGENQQTEILVAESLNQINFKINNVEFTSRLIEGEFPNWQKIIPTNFTSSAKINKEEFIKLVKIASIFARDSGSIIRLSLTSESKRVALLKVSANNDQIGSNEAECEIELSGAGGQIAFNFRYILEMLSSVEGEDVNFEMIESLNPGRLTVPGDDNYFHIIMPVRLQS
ncbi:DNA polymerase III subunit beta [Candidatus Curtissbacteria bacterium]|nr:DNA polymerase III subunit beta [Candidatus Curtissbacteria bacterium]